MVLSGIPGMHGVSVCANRALFSDFSNVISIHANTYEHGCHEIPCMHKQCVPGALSPPRLRTRLILVFTSLVPSVVQGATNMLTAGRR